MPYIIKSTFHNKQPSEAVLLPSLHVDGAGEILRPAPVPRSHLPLSPHEPRRRSCPISTQTSRHTHPNERRRIIFPPSSSTQSVTQSTQLETELLLHPESFRVPFYKTNILPPFPGLTSSQMSALLTYQTFPASLTSLPIRSDGKQHLIGAAPTVPPQRSATPQQSPLSHISPRG